MRQEDKSVIFEDIKMGPTAFERESFVPLLLSFIPQKIRRYSKFQFLHNPYIANLANFKDIEMGPMAFERESFVPQRIRKYSDFKISKMRQEAKPAIYKDISLTFVCIT